MKKKVLKIYFIIAVLCIVFLSTIFFYDSRHNTRQFYSSSSILEWSDYTITTGSGVTTLSGELILPEEHNNILAFYTAHVSVSAYLNNTLLYEYPVAYDYNYAKTAGYTWNFVYIPDSADHVTIILKSYYPTHDIIIPNFFVGNNMSVITKIFTDNLATLAICIIIFFLGVCMLVFWYAAQRRVKTNNKLLYLGVFAILLSVWSINESRLTILLIHNNIVSYYLAFISLLFLPATFCFFIQSYYKATEKIWSIFYVLDLSQIVICLLLQFFRVYDLRETLWSTHAMCLFLAAITFYYSIKLLIAKKNVRQVVIHLCCIIIFILSLIADMLAYYIGVWDNNVFGRIGFMIYLITMGLSSIRESTVLMRLGKKANTYHQLAYTDQMTSLNNRAAYERDFSSCSQRPDDTAVLDFDLNNLKKINDTYGHNMGDQYITYASQIIKQCFDSIGKCYRIGGDEFVVLIPNASKYDMDSLFLNLDKAVETHNADSHADWTMTIAYGYAIYDRELDTSLEDTYNRSDKKMYINKKVQKQNKNNGENC